MGVRLGVLILSLAGLLACASDPVPRAPRHTPGPPPLLEGTTLLPSGGAGQEAAAVDLQASADPLMASVGGRPVYASDLLESLLQRDSGGLKRALNLLIGSRLAQIEADALGLRIPPSMVEQRLAEHLSEFESAYLRPGESLDEFVRYQLDLDPTRFRDRLKDDTVREIVTERVVRAWSLATEHARVRVIVVDEAEAASAMLSRLEAGDDFAALAREHSLDATAEAGGLVPFLIRTDRAPLSRLAFDTAVGAVGGPMQLEQAFVLLLVEAMPAPVLGNWAEVGATVEDSLQAEAVSEEEFLVWQLAMEARHGVDVRPFHDFVGEPQF